MPPPGVAAGRVDFDSLEAARTERFIDGTQQTSFAMDSGATSAIYSGATGPNGTKTAVEIAG